MTKIPLQDGKYLVDVARKTIEKSVEAGAVVVYETKAAERLKEKQGVFVTILKYPSKELRGCIGLPRPERPLIVAIKEAATNAALADPRFNQVKPEELDNVVVEVTVLTPPELIKVDKPQEYSKHVEIGKHGLMVEFGDRSGLLLPQVATEMKLDAEQFLSETCYKAGLGFSDWLNPNIKIYRFEGQIFAEKEPRGEVVEKKLI
jgi:uncharacterized protein (TIGR00296 family)